MIDQYTPGPWVWRERWLVQENDSEAREFPGLSAIACDGSAYGEYGPTINPGGANARLIAAAPELLEALEAMFEKYQGSTVAEDWDAELAERVMGVISKATGGMR